MPHCLRYIFYFSTSWNKQPYTRGSYTALAVGSSQSDIESLAQPLFRNVHDKKVIICEFKNNQYRSSINQTTPYF